MRRALKHMLFAASFFSLFIAAEAQGDPVVTGVDGTFREGETLTIAGSGFGSKQPAAPLLWDDFEGGVNGVSVPEMTQKGWTISVGPGNTVTYSSSNNLSGSMLCSENNMQRTNGTNVANLNWQTATESLRNVFISFKAFFSFGTPVNPNDIEHQIKFWRIEDLAGNISLKTCHWIFNPGSPYVQTHTYGIGDRAFYLQEAQWPKDNEWLQIQCQARQSSPSQNDGSVEVWHAPASGRFIKIMDQQAIMTTDGSGYWGRLSLGQSYTSGYGTDITNFDDIYLDNTFARVEIGDAPLWTDCSKREMEVPISWSDNSISIKIHTGLIPFGTAYLYVTDANKVRNANGYPISVEHSPQWLAKIIDRWQAGTLARNDVNRAIYWYLKGTPPPSDPMAELDEKDVGAALLISNGN